MTNPIEIMLSIMCCTHDTVDRWYGKKLILNYIEHKTIVVRVPQRKELVHVLVHSSEGYALIKGSVLNVVHKTSGIEARAMVVLKDVEIDFSEDWDGVNE